MTNRRFIVLLILSLGLHGAGQHAVATSPSSSQSSVQFEPASPDAPVLRAVEPGGIALLLKPLHLCVGGHATRLGLARLPVKARIQSVGRASVQTLQSQHVRWQI